VAVVGFGLIMANVRAVWHVCGAAVGFIAVGIGGVFVFPLLIICIRDPERRSAIARHVIGFAFRCIVASMQAIGVFRYQMTGLERLQRHGLLILSNHPTLIDIVFLIAFVKRANCIVKSALWRNPFTRAAVTAAGYIRNDQHGLSVVEACVDSVRKGNNLIVFPEGTRTRPDGAMTLKRGAANVAVRASCNVTPVLIRCVPPMLTKGNTWWRLPSRTSQYRIDVKEDIDIRSFVTAAGSEALAARRLTRHLQYYFTKEMEAHAAV
jgi:1-acyl-sn-glycerol-3-phosphate acyltransferase